VLTESGIVRSDITLSFGSSTTKAEGVPLSVTMTINDFANNSPLAGGAVYLWHCDREGRYSLYSQGVTNENYLRGVQETDDQGQVKFTTIFPACYSGRWPHIHFEVYPSLAKATSSANKIATSQLALPEATAKAVYATSGYEQSISNLNRVSLRRLSR
jgi:protocatechuate 3,4-dioxygenase beta subunit